MVYMLCEMCVWIACDVCMACVWYVCDVYVVYIRVCMLCVLSCE